MFLLSFLERRREVIVYMAHELLSDEIGGEYY